MSNDKPADDLKAGAQTTERSYELRFKALEPKLRDCEQALEKAWAENERLDIELETVIKTLAEAGIEGGSPSAMVMTIAALLTASEADREKYRLAASVLCGAHIGVPQPTCPVCELGRIQTGLLDEIGRWRQMRDERDEAQRISDGRLETLLEKTEEARREWVRAEQAEADRNHAIATMVAASACLGDAGFKGSTIAEQVASVVVHIAEMMADNPEYDATDGAHPAYWRGHDHATAIFCQHVTEILDGKDDGAGANTEPWAGVRKRLLGLRQQLETANAILDQHRSLALTVRTDDDVDMYATFSRVIDERDELMARTINAEKLVQGVVDAVTDQGFFFFGDEEKDWVETIAWLKKHLSLTPEQSMREQYQEIINTWRHAYNRAEDQAAALRQQVREIGEAVKADAVKIARWHEEYALERLMEKSTERADARAALTATIRGVMEGIDVAGIIAACGAKAEDGETKGARE